jgi:hypothetical protein
MSEAIETDQAAAMMTIFEEVAAGSQGLIRDWQLLPNAQQALRAGGPEGLARFYRDCIERPGARAAWIKATLEATAGGRSSRSTGDSWRSIAPDLARTDIDNRWTPDRRDAGSASDAEYSSAMTTRAFSAGLTFHHWGHADIVRMALITAAHRPFLPEWCRCGAVGVRVR